MSILVTGTPGSGKTTLVNYAQQQGSTLFLDADEIDGLCEWRDFETGTVIGLVSDTAVKDDDDWFKKHGWYWKTDRLKQLILANPAVIVCGSAENIADCYQLFDCIIILRKTEAELLKNLQSPNRLNPFGKTTKQREGFMEWQDYLIKEARPYVVTYIAGNDIAKTYTDIMSSI